MSTEVKLSCEGDAQTLPRKNHVEKIRSASPDLELLREETRLDTELLARTLRVVLVVLHDVAPHYKEDIGEALQRIECLEALVSQRE